MVKYTENNISTPWLSSKKPSDKELEKLNVEQLLIIAKRKKSFKKSLIKFIYENS